MFLGSVHFAYEIRAKLPALATNCRVLIRHSKSVQEGPGETRTLEQEGIELCHTVRQDYNLLLESLRGYFGDPRFVHSRFIRAALTGWEIFHPAQFAEDPRISLGLSLKKIQGGKWHAGMKAAKKTVGQMIIAVHNDRKLLSDQPYERRIVEFNAFFTTVDDNNHLTIGFSHEPEPTLWALSRGFVPNESAGLAECQAYIVFTDNKGTVLGIIKFCPPATFK